MQRGQALGEYRVGSPLAVGELRFARSSSADLPRRVGHDDSSEMGVLLTAEHPPVPPRPLPRSAPALTGRVTSVRWPGGGPPAELLGLSPSPSTSTSTSTSTSVEGDVTARRITEVPALEGPGAAASAASPCARCGKPLPAAGRCRPALYCSGACRTAAHRAAHRSP